MEGFKEWQLTEDVRTLINNGGEAYGWGNHANAGYATEAYVNDELITKENTLQSGTSHEIIDGIDTTDKKWSAKVLRVAIREIETKSSVITAKGFEGSPIPTPTAPQPLTLTITNVNQLGLTKSTDKLVKLPISESIYEISVLATGGYAPNETALINIHFGGRVRAIAINANMSSFSYQTEAFNVSKESERDIVVNQSTTLLDLEITLTIKKLSN